MHFDTASGPPEWVTEIEIGLNHTYDRAKRRYPLRGQKNILHFLLKNVIDALPVLTKYFVLKQRGARGRYSHPGLTLVYVRYSADEEQLSPFQYTLSS